MDKDEIDNQQENSWSDIFSRGFEKIKIGNMDQEDFRLLITQENALNNGTVKYTPEALEYLWQFTKGHALYSCLLGNRTLDIMSNRKVKRDVIYPSDIFIAIYQSGKYLPDEKSNKDKEIEIKKQIFQDIINNVPIKFVGKTLARMQASGERRVSYQKLKDYIEQYRPDIFNDFDGALSVLVARDFITYDEIDIQHQFDRSRDDDRKTAREYFFTSDLYLEHFANVYVSDLSSREKEEIESKKRSIEALELELRTRTFEEIEELRTRLPSMFKGAETRVIHTDKYVEGDDRSNSVTINAQTINSAFSTLLAPGTTSENFLAAFNSLPRLTAYFGDDQRKRIYQGSQNLLAEYGTYETCFDESGECIDETRREEIERRIIVQEAELEKMSAPAEQKLLSDTVGAVVNSEDFMTLSDKRWQELLKRKDSASVAKLKSLPSEFVAPLTFAVVLHNVFDNVCKNAEQFTDEKRNLTQELDYCPVAIMYCKIVEAMLKQGHTPIYIRGLGEKPLKNGGQTKFADLGTPEEFDITNKDLSIGSYVSHLVYLPKWKFSLDTPQQKPRANDFWFTAKFKGESIDFIDNIRSLIGDEYQEDEMLPAWKTHARALKVIHEIRNRSAHEAVSITKENFDWLIEVLFKQGELLKIWELAEKGSI